MPHTGQRLLREALNAETHREHIMGNPAKTSPQVHTLAIPQRRWQHVIDSIDVLLKLAYEAGEATGFARGYQAGLIAAPRKTKKTATR